MINSKIIKLAIFLSSYLLFVFSFRERNYSNNKAFLCSIILCFTFLLIESKNLIFLEFRNASDNNENKSFRLGIIFQNYRNFL